MLELLVMFKFFCVIFPFLLFSQESEKTYSFYKIWTYEILKIGNHSIYLNQIVSALIVLLIGIVFIKYLKFYINRKFIKQITDNSNVRLILNKLVSFVLFFILLLFVFNIVNIPLSIFTFLGGAFAIAFGFGAKELLNNFISGIIVMIEQPIKIGDVVQIDEDFGKIINIGIRSTRMKLFNGSEILIPNSFFLDRKIVNLTHDDKLMRYTIDVGVAYSSDLKKVKNLLENLISGYKEILKNPKPLVSISAFEASYINFKIYYWIDISVTDPREIKTRIYVDIKEQLDLNGINIPFLQVDINLKKTEFKQL